MAKRKRRQEWDDRIAAVQEEIDDLMDEERRLLESLSARKPRQLSTTTVQSRSYRAGNSVGSIESRNAQLLANRAFSTKTIAKEKAPAEENATNEYMDEDNWAITQEAHIDKAASAEKTPFNETNRKDRIDEEAVEKADEDDYGDFDDGFSTMNTIVPRPEPDFIWEQSSILRIKAIQKLAIQQLTYRFLLRPSVAHDYSGLPVEYRLDDSSGAHTSVLLSRLRGIRQRLYSLKYIRNSAYDDLMSNVDLEELDELRTERERYDLLLKQDIDQFMKNKIRLPQLLSLISENLSICEDPDRPEAFSLLITFFNRLHQNDLSDMVIKCLVPNLFKLSTPLIVAIVTHFRKTKNLKDFDLFLQMLRGEGGYPVNLKTLWVKKNVNGITVTVPPTGSFSPLLITSVITATLRFDQPEKAEAYLHVARVHGFVDNMSTLTAFLRFYGIRNDFESGSSTLVNALNFLSSTSEHEEDRVSRLILCMADFSARCGRHHLCEMFLDAAVRSGFDCRLAHVSEHSRSETNYLLGTLKKWRRAQINSAAEFSQQDLTLHEKCTKFVDLTAAKVIYDQHKVTQTKEDITPNPVSNLPEETPNSQPLPLRWVKSETYINERIPTRTSTTRHPIEDPAKIRKLRAQLDFLHQRIDKLSLAGGRDGSREDE